MKHHTRHTGVLAAAFIIATAAVSSITGRQAHAIPEDGSIGIRAVTAKGMVIGGVNVLVTHVAGDYPMLPLVITTENPGLVWIAVHTGTYSLVALDDAGDPIPATEIVLFVPSGAHDIIVVLHLPPACDADLDDDGMVGVTDMLALLAAWGTDPGGPPDINGDHVVNIFDLLGLLATWGDCPPT